MNNDGILLFSCPKCKKRNLNGRKGLRIHLSRFCPKTKATREANKAKRIERGNRSSGGGSAVEGGSRGGDGGSRYKTGKKRGRRPLKRRRGEDSDGDSSMNSDHDNVCDVCNLGGDVLCCGTCSLVFHLKCLHPSLSKIPSGKWSCPHCVLDGLAPRNTEKEDVRRAKEAIAVMKSAQNRISRKRNKRFSRNGTFSSLPPENVTVLPSEEVANLIDRMGYEEISQNQLDSIVNSVKYGGMTGVEELEQMKQNLESMREDVYRLLGIGIAFETKEEEETT